MHRPVQPIFFPFSPRYQDWSYGIGNISGYISGKTRTGQLKNGSVTTVALDSSFWLIEVKPDVWL